MIRYNAKGEFNVPFGRYQHLNTSLVSQEHSNLLSNTKIYNKDYKEIFDMNSNMVAWLKILLMIVFFLIMETKNIRMDSMMILIEN